MSVVFDQLRISNDGLKMYIDIHINKASYFDNVYLRDITIMTSDKVSETAPEGVIVNPSTNLPTDCIYYLPFGENDREATLVIDKGVLDAAFVGSSEDGATATLAFNESDFSKGLFFVYVRVKGIPDECTPCGLDAMTTVGVTFNEGLLYQRVMDYTRDFADDCVVPTGFADFILLWNAFKSAIATGHYIPAIKFFNMLFGIDSEGDAYGPYNKNSGVALKGCRCHG